MSRASVRGFYMLMGGGAAVALQLFGEYPDAVAGVAYDHSLDILGGDAPFNAGVIDGSVPLGLTLEMHQTEPRKVRMHGVPVGALGVHGTLPSTRPGEAYSERLQVFNAVEPVNLSIVSGAMPSWMTMTWHAATQEIEFHGMPA